VIPLDAADLVLVAARLWDLRPERALDRIDLAALDRALAEPVPRPGDPAATAAALLCGLRRQHPVPAGNDRFALVATAQLLAVNGWLLDAGSPQALADLVRRARRPSRAARGLRRTLSRIPTATRRTMMVTRLTDRAGRALDLAQEEARQLTDHAVLPHHLLLGLIRAEEGEGGTATEALAALGVDLRMARLAVAEVSAPDQDPPTGTIALAPRTRQLLDSSAGEARLAGRIAIDTEHLLLALVRQTDGHSRRVLEVLGAAPDEVREQVLRAGRATPREADPAEVVRRAVDAAIDAGDLELAADLRRHQQELSGSGGAAEVSGLRAEITRLRELLRENEVDPDSRPTP
jgi:hypothetical protein